MLQNPKWDEGLLDLTKPSLKALSYILRHKELWPEGFEWGFTRCESCAMGLAYELWQLGNRKRCTIFSMGRKLTEVFAMKRETFSNIFEDKRPLYHTWNVTPEMVADQIDNHLVSA